MPETTTYANDEWTPLPIVSNGKSTGGHHKLGPWLRPRGFTSTGNVIRTTSAYSLTKLLYHLPSFGGIQGLINLQKQDKLLESVLDAIPFVCRLPFTVLQQPGTHSNAKDEAARLLADYLNVSHATLPVRLPTLEEIVQEAEVESIFSHSPQYINLVNDFEKYALVGNYFKPSAFLVAVLGDTNTGLRTFLSDAPFAPQQCKPLSLEDMKKCHSQLINEVEALCRTEPSLVSRIHRTIIPVGYEFLLREDFDAKLRIFCQAPVSYPDVLKRAFKLQDIPQHVLNQVSKKQEPVSGITAIADQKYVKKLAVAVSLAELPCIELTDQNIRMLPDPVGTLQAQTLGTGLQFVQTAKEHVHNLSSHLEKIGASFFNHR